MLSSQGGHRSGWVGKGDLGSEGRGWNMVKIDCKILEGLIKNLPPSKFTALCNLRETTYNFNLKCHLSIRMNLGEKRQLEKNLDNFVKYKSSRYRNSYQVAPNDFNPRI